MDELVVEYGSEKELHVILDNYCTHKKNDKWLESNKNVTFHYTPTSASWLNLVEVWFGIFTRKSLNGASFSSTQKLSEHISAYVKAANENPVPFIWKKREVKESQLKNNIVVLKAINPDKFLLIRKNPEEFISKSAKLINEVKASLIINNIVYHKTEERHDAKTVFANDKSAIRQSEFLKNHIYDYLTTDSKTEARFAEALESSSQVSVYAKLPKSFYITTPVANYSPDWAIVFDKESVRHIYFVAETKGSDSNLELREIESLKIHCAGEHFKSISGQEVQFSKVSSYEQMLEIVKVT